MDTIHTLHYKYILQLYANDNCRGPTPQQLKPITVGPFNDKYLETAVNNIVQTSTMLVPDDLVILVGIMGLGTTSSDVSSIPLTEMSLGYPSTNLATKM